MFFPTLFLLSSSTVETYSRARHWGINCFMLQFSAALIRKRQQPKVNSATFFLMISDLSSLTERFFIRMIFSLAHYALFSASFFGFLSFPST